MLITHGMIPSLLLSLSALTDAVRGLDSSSTAVVEENVSVIRASTLHCLLVDLYENLDLK